MNALFQESLDLRARYDEEPSHSDQVAHAGLANLRRPATVAPPRRAVARVACIALRCCTILAGPQTPDGKGHHKWSARLIQEHSWKNLSKSEVALVAQVARYHRKGPPEPDHADFHALKPAARTTVMILGGILRVADALDRTHSAKIARVKASATKQSITMRVETGRAVGSGTNDVQHQARHVADCGRAAGNLCSRMKNRPIQLGVVGCGWIMRSAYTPTLLSLSEAARVAAVCDLNKAAAHSCCVSFSGRSGIQRPPGNVAGSQA